jgi:PAS domain S-box-containing protein
MKDHEILKTISFQTAIRGVEMYGLILTTLEGRILSWNSGATQLLGYADTEAINQNFALIFTEEDRANKVPEKEIAKALSKGYAYDDRWHVRRDKSQIYVNGGLCLLKTDAGEPLGFVKIIRDQTEKKRHQEEIDQLHAKLLEAHNELQEYASNLESKVQKRTELLNERNAELQDFCYSIAHDIRAPLRSIQAMSQVVLDDYDSALDENGKKYLARIVQAGSQLDQLTIDLLEYTRFSREEITLTPISLDKVVEEVLSNLAEVIEQKGAKVTIREPLPLAYGQHAYTVQILGNFLSNALKFVKPGEKPLIEISSELIDNKVRINVKDNGIGISPEYQEKIFVLFERLNPQGTYEGTGAGLTIARKAARRMNGDIGITSKPGEGSIFWLDLSVAE